MMLAIGLSLSLAQCNPPPAANAFCRDVTYHVSLPLGAAELDAAARSDYEVAVERQPHSNSLCLESWKALQCASKFQKCAPQQPAQKVCRSLCVRLAHSCNATDGMLSRCADSSVYDDVPCTDYAAREAGASSAELPAPSPAEALQTAAGLPVLLGFAAVILHAAYCLVQCLCGGGTASDEGEVPVPREALQSLLTPHTEMTAAGGGGEM